MVRARSRVGAERASCHHSCFLGLHPLLFVNPDWDYPVSREEESNLTLEIYRYDLVQFKKLE